MKQLIFIFVFGIMSLVSFGQTDFTNMSEVVQCEGMNAATIYSNIMQNWTNLNGANEKGENSLDYCDKEAGIINIKTKFYLGFHKTNIAYGYDGYADALVTFKIKDDRYKVTVTTNTVTFKWTAPAPNNDSETIAIDKCYPEFTAKTKLYKGYIKKASNDLVLEKMPTLMEKYFNVCKTLHINTEDDF